MAIAEDEFVPETAASPPPQGEDDVDSDEEGGLEDHEREELENRVRSLGRDLTNLAWRDRDALLMLLSNEIYYPL